MTPDRFDSLCAAWGSDLDRWPAAERDAAVELIAASAEARALQANAAALDDLLDAYAIAPADQALVQRVSSMMTPRGIPPTGSGLLRPLAGRLTWWWTMVAGIGFAGVAVGSLAVTVAAGSALPLPAGGPLGSAWPATAFSGLLSDDGFDE